MSVLNLSGDDAVECPLCMEPLEVDDLNFFPCTCGYQICRFCWHRIRTDENGLCPACRKAYSENPADFKPLTKEEISRLKAEKRLKDQQRKQRVTENRKHLANVRVVQKNLVFVVGLPMRLAEADVLKRHEYFGKFGKIHKVVINQSTSYAGSQGPSASAYVTYQRQEDALRAIEAVNNIVVDGRTIKTSLGTTKYCSHFMRNQACPKSDCMYLHDLGDQEASFTKEEMHQGKHQDYERKLVQALHAQTSTPLNRKPISPPVGNSIRENGSTSITTQIKEAWPSLQPGQPPQTLTLTKDSSAQVIDHQQQQLQSQSNDTSINTNSKSLPSHSNGTSQQQNNNNKGESGSITTEKGSSSRRGKSNSESKAQAARNKHKNNQNKEKHGAVTGTRTTSRSESSNSSNSNSNGANTTQSHTHTIDNSHLNGQKLVKNYSNDMINGQEQQTSRCKKNNTEQQNIYKDKDNDNDNDNDNEIDNDIANEIDNEIEIDNDQRQINVNSSTTKELEESLCEMKLNGIDNGIGGNSCGNSESDSELLREGSTPASTASSTSTSDDLGLINISTDRLIVDANVSDDNDESDLISDPSPIIGTNLNLSTTSQVAPPGLYNSNNNNNHINNNNNISNNIINSSSSTTMNGTQAQVNHRSIFQTDNNSFFSSNTFQKLPPSVMSLTSNSQTTPSNTIDWTTTSTTATCLAPIPDSLPSVHSSEDWQAAFGFPVDKCRTNNLNNHQHQHQHHRHRTLSPASSSSSPSVVPFNTESLLSDEDYLDTQYSTTQSSKLHSNYIRDHSSALINPTPASKFMADFQQNSCQQRLLMQAQQNQENCQYIKQNGHTLDSTILIKKDMVDMKPEDDLGFDPFDEIQKGLAELMENEAQVQQQRQFQQQQQHQHQHLHQRRDELTRGLQHQGFPAPSLAPPHFSQVAHLAHLQQQAHHLQNLQVLQQSHTILSRLPQMLQQQPTNNVQTTAQPTMSVGGSNNSLGGQRSRLPPPGFPSSTPNHMNSFGLGIPRVAPTTNSLGTQPPQQTSYLPNGVNKCVSDAVYGLKDWCDITQQQSAHTQTHQPFHHHQQQQQQQQLHQKSSWNNLGPITDWTTIDPAIVSSSRPLQFQAASTWQFSRFHPTIHNGPHNTQQETDPPVQHWAMQPPPGFGGPASSGQLNGPAQSSTAAQPHSKLISAGSEIEN
ncbi:uncharacterized protein DDB_G0283357 [Microplitis mediator]|uniref:uncharacterized protein DDB_G0283357 n=1 Tax=Microplitis mediator TaxID=375433 RepID=UPI0025559579|nr:uncharacterized protein DDB_G0283357 [Microplitis mediator]XP_057332684.1 uncharacterized protein DDB_G0283357 [Microplitis mediator]XP_057332686.1 uncharacterized protein DDB_G0283357 [Microplitis mediator]XP_057332687.1 uncharacterized protein DDB_G0283357 [Microplitis mediator]XP_057332688.1 uncharacterized protein DDB_G0283357 [Microplitis mediator]XP_057332689.1 uncharacterized protein DDB_G0283357 [Microplitis mediator]